jgi:hypothetical protein
MQAAFHTRQGPASEVLQVGERVWIWNGQWLPPFGAAAQYTADLVEQGQALGHVVLDIP